MALASSQSPRRACSRRVLGDISPNTRITTANAVAERDDKPTTTPIGSPLKKQQSLTPAAVLAVKAHWHPSPYISGKKRTWDAMDGVNDCENYIPQAPQESPLRHESYLSPPTPEQVLPPSVPAIEVMDDTSTTEEESLANSPKHFHLGPDVTKRPTGTSFSSLIDYDPAEASDNSKSASVSPLGSVGSVESTKPPTRAETLRLRLRMAMYKVTTDQIYVPLPDLELPRPTSARRPSSASSAEDLFELDSRPYAADLTAALLPEKPTLVTTAPAGARVSKLLPAPVFEPTSFSSRNISYEHDGIASSPPAAAAVMPPAPTPPRARFYATPAAKRVQMMSALDALSPQKADLEEREELTSSVVKGKAASSLLELHRRG